MAERRWGAIASGATFETLATTIVFFEDHAAALFGRRGKDGGQDARSGDGTTVFQAKFHHDGSADAAIRDARAELAKLRNHRIPGAARYEQWKSITHWTLITNAAFNPTDRETWDRDIVSAFKREGITATYWERENLNGFLDKHPEIHRSFFEHETRVFLSIAEIAERLPRQQVFLEREQLSLFCGREAELASVRAFLESPRQFLVVHGAGGVGKTRLLIEVGDAVASEGSWQVLWANVATMNASSVWFEGIVPERRTLLLVDEPVDDALLQQLSEQLGYRLGRTAAWKVAVAVRSPKDPVLRFLLGPRMKSRVCELPLEALEASAAQAMCSALLSEGALARLPPEQISQVAADLSQRFARHPVWLTLAIHLLEVRGDLTKVPATATDLAAEYLEEVERAQRDLAPERVRNILQAVALLGRVNREDDDCIEWVRHRADARGLTEARSQLASLVARRALVEWGARNRFVEFKPDVLRDHVLRSWLVVDVGFGVNRFVASDDAKELVDALCKATIAGELPRIGRAILVAMARTQLVLRFSAHHVPIVDGYFDALRNAAPGMAASERLAIVEVLESLAVLQPMATTQVLEALRQGVTPDEETEGIFGKQILGHGDVLLALAWPLFHAAMGAQNEAEQEAVLRALCSVTEAEANLEPHLKRALPNDGRRAAALLPRVLEGGPQFWSDFTDVARKLGEELLRALMDRSPTLGDLALLKALVEPIVSVERSRIWFDDRAFHIQHYAIGTGDPAWSTRSALLDRVKESLGNDSIPLESRLALWSVLAHAHKSINLVVKAADQTVAGYQEMLIEDLRWARTRFTEAEVIFAELAAARELWHWHHRYGPDNELKAISSSLESLYIANDLAAEFEPLLHDEDHRQRAANMSNKGTALAATSALEIAAFVERAIRFLGSEEELNRLMSVAWSLGRTGESAPAVQEFVKTSLKQRVGNVRADFVNFAAASWVVAARDASQPRRCVELVRELLVECDTDQQRANLLHEIYGRRPSLHDVRALTDEEHSLLRAQRQLFLDAGRAPQFVGAIAQLIHHDWSTARDLLEAALRETPPQQLKDALRTLIDGLYWAVREDDAPMPPAGLGQWLLDQLVLSPDPDDLRGNAEWYLGEIFKKVGRAHASWLPRALAFRGRMEREQGGVSRWRAVGHSERFSEYVERVTESTRNDAAVQTAIDDLLDLGVDTGSIGYNLPAILRDIDPTGLVVPRAVVDRIARSSNPHQLRALARIGSAYIEGTPAWRQIAAAAITASARHSVEDQRSVLWALGERGVRSWSGTPGEVAAVFVSAVDGARAALEAENDPTLRSFWQWRLSGAEAELRHEEERAKEERGE